MNITPQTQNILIIIGVIICIILTALILYEKHAQRKELENYLNNSLNMYPEDFENLKKEKDLYAQYNQEGIYIFHNETLDKAYVGQGIRVLDRVKNHLAGRGNGDVYADHKYGHKFSIKIVLLQNTNRISLNQLEREYIERYNAYHSGYNRTRGNKN